MFIVDALIGNRDRHFGNWGLLEKECCYNVTSCYHMNDKRIFYHEIFKDPPRDLEEAIIRIVPLISMEKIDAIIDATPQMSDVRKEYLKKSVEIRYTQILLPALKRLF